MVRYHISPTTGNPNKCTASPGNCPFKSAGGQEALHYASKEAARKGYELQQSASTATVKKPLAEVLHDLPEGRLLEAEAILTKANRRLERTGITERFTWTVERYLAPLRERGRAVPGLLSPRVKLAVNRPTIGYEGYTFLAVVDQTADGELLLRSAHGVELSGELPEKLLCEHCGRSIARQKTYILEDSSGKRIQLGSNCVKTYLGGIKPAGLWALGLDPLEEAHENKNWGQGGGKDYAAPTETLMAYALAVSNEGSDFVSRSRASYTGEVPTSDAVEAALLGHDKSAEEVQKRAQALERSGAAREALAIIEAQADASTDYGKSLLTLSSSEYTHAKHTALLVSGLTAIAKQKKAEARAKEESYLGPASSGYATFLGDRVNGMGATVRKVMHRDAYDHNGDPIVKSQVILRDKDNHEMIWWASKKVELKSGDKLVLTGGTVKDHSNYRGVDQTVLTRLKYDTIGNEFKEG